MGSRRGWKDRIAEVRKRNPGALPAWLNAGSGDAAWYRARWQVDGGIAPDDAARPAVFVIKWLAKRGLLTRHGADALWGVDSNIDGTELNRMMMTPKGAGFLDEAFDDWWSKAGINLTTGPEGEPFAAEELDRLWSDFGRRMAAK